jgi:hypothetical protein
MAVLLEAERSTVFPVFLNPEIAVRIFYAHGVARACVRGLARMIAIRTLWRLDVIRVPFRRHLRFLLGEQRSRAERVPRHSRAEA